MPSVTELLDLINKGGLVAFLLLSVWGFYTEKWVAGTTHQRTIKERDAFRDELFMTLRLADRATGISERTVDTIVQRFEDNLSHVEAERQLRSRGERMQQRDSDQSPQ